VIIFLVIILHTTVTTRALSAFPGDRLSSVLVNLSAKNIYAFIRVSPWMVSSFMYNGLKWIKVMPEMLHKFAFPLPPTPPL